MRLMKRCGLVIVVPSQRGFDRAQPPRRARGRPPRARALERGAGAGAPVAAAKPAGVCEHYAITH